MAQAAANVHTLPKSGKTVEVPEYLFGRLHHLLGLEVPIRDTARMARLCRRAADDLLRVFYEDADEANITISAQEALDIVFAFEQLEKVTSALHEAFGGGEIE